MHAFVRDRSVGERVKHSLFLTSSAALCPDPPEIDHGSFSLTGANSIGDVAHYDCDLGFKLVGVLYLTCTQTSPYAAEFQPEPPICQREYCMN